MLYIFIQADVNIDRVAIWRSSFDVCLVSLMIILAISSI